MNNRSVPTAIMLPHLVYCRLAEAGAWLTRVFGFSEHYRHGEPVSGIQMYLGSAYIMLTGPREGRSNSPTKLGYGTQMLTIIVADVETHYAKTRREGGVIWEELHETIYGEKQYGATDLEGHRWLFSQHARDVSPDSWGATIAPHNF
ncbi:MAG: VOC family protein [Candidatus Acidiferrum sp.]